MGEWTREDAVDFITRHASVNGLLHECMSAFDMDEANTILSGRNVDYHQLALDALYEWDI